MQKKILIVDDEPHIRILLEQSLEEFEDRGVELLKAINGVMALQMIVDHRPDLVFLDVMMPQMNGYEVCRSAREQLQDHPIHIVLLTAKGQESDRKLGFDHLANSYMTKPFNPDEIVKITQDVLGL